MSSSFLLESSAFESGTSIPSHFTCDGENVSPPLSWRGIPEGAVSFALIMDDPDVPKALKPDGVFDHWTLFNLPAGRQVFLREGEVPTDAILGANGAGKNGYTGPCPPREYQPNEHRYFFRLYALDSLLSLGTGATKQEVLKAMEGHILGQAELMGRYKRP